MTQTMKKVFSILSILLLSSSYSCNRVEETGGIKTEDIGGAEHPSIASISQQNGRSGL